MSNKENTSFDPESKEAQLRSESESWDTSTLELATDDDIPVLDLSEYFMTNSEASLTKLAEQLLDACTHTGFYTITGHGISNALIEKTFLQSKRFHDLSLDQKLALKMDQATYPVAGVGYLPFQNKKLPTRTKGNANEAFIIKRELGPRNITLNDNQWPEETTLPGFRTTIEGYAKEMESLALKLLPIYARALQLPLDFFDAGFQSPLYRLRLTKYPPMSSQQNDEFGIAPHVDTTFFTILSQDSPGLTIYSEQRGCWIQSPVLNDSFVVNTGELLKQWTNDRFISVKHFANNNTTDNPRYSIPFFFNASADYPMQCIPTCCDEDNPAKYPTISYLESQSIAQGE